LFLAWTPFQFLDGLGFNRVPQDTVSSGGGVQIARAKQTRLIVLYKSPSLSRGSPLRLLCMNETEYAVVCLS